jgi:transcriptional regulator with XRE-family HTH domain
MTDEHLGGEISAFPKGTYLKYVRMMSGMTLKQAGVIAGLPHTFLGDIENDAKNMPVPRLDAISKAYGLSSAIVSRVFGIPFEPIDEPSDEEIYLLKLMADTPDLKSAETFAYIANSIEERLMGQHDSF